jgi:glycosyltransferase involved in cell wall biosynthesis
MRNRPTLTVCMIARNESKRLPAAIRSVGKIADQVVVVDTGSTDDTVELARSLGAEVIGHAWKDDFADARNRSLKEARSDWVLCLDADEYVTPEGQEALVAAMTGGADAYMVRIESRVDSTAGKVFVNFFPRLFRNVKGIGFEGKVHEQVTPSLERLGLSIRISDIVIKHSGYALSPSGLKAKAERNAALLLKELEDHPGDPLALFHLGEAYSMLEHHADAVASYDRALAAGKVDATVRAALLQNKGTALVRLKAYDKAVVSLRRAREVDPGLLTVHLVMASALYGMKKYERAEQEVLSYISRCREIERVRRVTLGHDPDVSNALVMLAKCRLALCRLDEARAALEDAVRMGESGAQAKAPEPGSERRTLGTDAIGDARVLLGRIAFEGMKFGQAAKHFEQAVNIYPNEAKLRFELARAYLACGSNGEAVRTLENAVEYGLEQTDLLRCLGLMKIKQKDFAGAIETYRRILDAEPSDADSRKKLAGLYHAAGDSRLAREVLSGR